LQESPPVHQVPSMTAMFAGCWAIACGSQEQCQPGTGNTHRASALRGSV
jgi:hypothetical protein